MTREIKFRAWDKTDNRWLESQEFSISGNGGIQTFGVYHPCDVMQYTGLKDKNGKEIYEEDVVRHRDNQLAEWRNDKIIFENGGFIAKSNQSLQRQTFIGEQMEIIGNIYENPTMLGEMRNNKTDV